MIFVGGAYSRPVVVGLRQQETELQKRKDVPSPARENESIQTEIQRIDLSPTHDMAYEFSRTRVTFDEGGKHSAFHTYTLRVWKKVKDKWRVAAMMERDGEPEK